MTRLTSPIGSPLIIASATCLYTGIILEIETKTCTGNGATGTIFGGDVTGKTINIAIKATIHGGNSELTTWTSRIAIRRTIPQVIDSGSVIFAGRAGK